MDADGTGAGGRRRLQRSGAGAGEWHEDKGDKWRKGECGPGGGSLIPRGAEAGAQDGPWQPLRPLA